MTIDLTKLFLTVAFMFPVVATAQIQDHDSLNKDTSDYIYVMEGAKLKAKPVVGSQVLTTLRHTQAVKLLDSVDRHYYVTANGISGYIMDIWVTEEDSRIPFSDSLRSDNESNKLEDLFRPIDQIHIGMNVGGSSVKGTQIGMHFGGRNGFAGCWKGLLNSPDVQGENYNGIISWNEFAEDYLEEGTWNTAWYLGCGYYTQHFFVSGYLGSFMTHRYLQSFDQTRILSSTGYYYITGRQSSFFDPMVEVGAHISFLTFSLTATPQQGIGWTVGAVWKLSN